MHATETVKYVRYAPVTAVNKVSGREDKECIGLGSKWNKQRNHVGHASHCSAEAIAPPI